MVNTQQSDMDSSNTSAKEFSVIDASSASKIIFSSPDATQVAHWLNAHGRKQQIWEKKSGDGFFASPERIEIIDEGIHLLFPGGQKVIRRASTLNNWIKSHLKECCKKDVELLSCRVAKDPEGKDVISVASQCVQCGKTFRYEIPNEKLRRMCSPKCAAAASREAMPPGTKVQFTCLGCGEPFYDYEGGSKEHCPKCRETTRREKAAASKAIDEEIYQLKTDKGWTFRAIASHIGGLSVARVQQRFIKQKRLEEWKEKNKKGFDASGTEKESGECQ